MTRIGVLTTSYPRHAGDHAGSFVEGHVRALRALGHTVDVLAAGDPDRDTATRIPGGPATDGATRIPGGPFYRGGAPDALERSLAAALPAAAFTARFAAAAHRLRRARGWELVIAHWLAPSALVALTLGLPTLAIAHGGDVHTLRRLHLLAPTLHALHRRRARLAFVSDELLALARAAAPRLAPYLATAIVQPMGLDLPRFAAIRRRPATPPRLLVVARLVPVKGVDTAIAAFARLPAATARLVIAGDGPQRAALEALAARIPGVDFLGEVPTTRRDQLLGEATVVVIPSRHTPTGRTEGTPLIALEALAAGVPVIASAVGGLAALPGLRLVPPDDPAALAAALTSPALPDSPADLSHLDWPRVAERLLRSP